MGVHWKILLLGGFTKNQYVGKSPKKGGFVQFADLIGGGELGEKEGGGWYPNAHYALTIFIKRSVLDVLQSSGYTSGSDNGVLETG